MLIEKLIRFNLPIDDNSNGSQHGESGARKFAEQIYIDYDSQPSNESDYGAYTVGQYGTMSIGAIDDNHQRQPTNGRTKVIETSKDRIAYYRDEKTSSTHESYARVATYPIPTATCHSITNATLFQHHSIRSDDANQPPNFVIREGRQCEEADRNGTERELGSYCDRSNRESKTTYATGTQFSSIESCFTETTSSYCRGPPPPYELHQQHHVHNGHLQQHHFG